MLCYIMRYGNLSSLSDWKEIQIYRWTVGEWLEREMSYHSQGENMVSEKFLKFMFGLEKEQKQNCDDPQLA